MALTPIKPNKHFEPTAQKLRFWIPSALRAPASAQATRWASLISALRQRMEALHESFVGYLPIRKDCHPTSKCGDRLDCYAGSSITQVIIFRAGVSTKPIRLTERPSNGFAQPSQCIAAFR